MTVDEFFTAISEAKEAYPGIHTLHSPASLEMIAEWEARTGHDLPQDLKAVLLRSNGLGLKQAWFEGKPTFHEGAFRL